MALQSIIPSLWSRRHGRERGRILNLISASDAPLNLSFQGFGVADVGTEPYLTFAPVNLAKGKGRRFLRSEANRRHCRPEQMMANAKEGVLRDSFVVSFDAASEVTGPEPCCRQRDARKNKGKFGRKRRRGIHAPTEEMR